MEKTNGLSTRERADMFIADLQRIKAGLPRDGRTLVDLLVPMIRRYASDALTMYDIMGSGLISYVSNGVGHYAEDNRINTAADFARFCERGTMKRN